MLRPRHVARGVELFAARTPTLPPATHTNCYALGTGEMLIVEPAPSDPAEQRAFVDWVQQLRSTGREPVAILATHHHADHIGGARELPVQLDLPLWAHEETARRLGGVSVDRLLVDGDIIELGGPVMQRWQVLHTPGHAPGHLCLHNAVESVVVLGDMVSPLSTIVIAPPDGEMAEYVRQLRRLSRLDARLGVAAHGDPIDDPGKLLRATATHRIMRENKVIAALREAGEASIEQLMPVVYSDTAILLWPIARASLQAHLIKLREEGRALCVDERWRVLAS